MLKLVVRLTFVLLLATIFYDVMRCQHFRGKFLVQSWPTKPTKFVKWSTDGKNIQQCGTQTYRYIRRIGRSKYGKIMLKKFKKVKKKYLKFSVFPTSHGVPEDQVEPYVHFIDWPVNFEKSAIFFIQNLIISLGKIFSGLQYPTFMSFGNLLRAAKVSVTVVSQKMQKCAGTTMGKLLQQYGRNLVCHHDST